MIVDVVMPKMGESITEGTILEWRKKVGDPIALDEILLEIGTDKVDSEIPSSAAGTVVEILADPNDIKDVGDVIARIDTDGNSAKKQSNKEPSSESTSEPLPDPKKEIKIKPGSLSPMSVKPRVKKFYTPVVMKIATEQGLPLSELETISGTGRGGRVTKKDILAYIEGLGSAKERLTPIASVIQGSTEEMHHMRKLIANHMKESIETSAHVYVMIEVDMTTIVDFVESKDDSFCQKEGFNLTFTPFIVDAVVKSLQDYPEMNASISGTTITYHKNINIGLAVAVENGLMVPSMANCEEKNFLGLCRSVNDVAKRTRSSTISADELSGSTFSISNFGVFGVSIGTPIINQPNVGILGVGKIKKQPIVVEYDEGDAIAIRSMMMLSLGFDHRMIDGAGGAKFLSQVKNNLETMDLNTVF